MSRALTARRPPSKSWVRSPVPPCLRGHLQVAPPPAPMGSCAAALRLWVAREPLDLATDVEDCASVGFLLVVAPASISSTSLPRRRLRHPMSPCVAGEEGDKAFHFGRTVRESVHASGDDFFPRWNGRDRQGLARAGIPTGFNRTHIFIGTGINPWADRSTGVGRDKARIPTGKGITERGLKWESHLG
jgi:hypothetical protein